MAPWPSGYLGGAVDQQGAQTALHHGQGVLGDEARTLVQVVQIRAAVVHDHFVEAAQEQCAGLRGAHHHRKAVAGGIVDEEQRDPAQPRRAGAEVLAVGEHALHALGVAPTPGVAVTLVRSLAGRQPHPPAGAPHRGAIDLQVDRDDAALARPAHQFRHRGARITLFLGAHKGDQLRAQRLGSRDAGARLRFQGSQAAGSPGSTPALHGAYADPQRATVQVHAVATGNLPYRGSRRVSAQHQGLRLGDCQGTHHRGRRDR